MNAAIHSNNTEHQIVAATTGAVTLNLRGYGLPPLFPTRLPCG